MEIKKKGDADLTNGYKILKENDKRCGFNCMYLYTNKVCTTLTSKQDSQILYDYERYLNKDERISIGSWSKDYDFLGQQVHYVLGMSVPPLAMYRISKEIEKQWLDK